jgi:hypothetical protein
VSSMDSGDEVASRAAVIGPALVLAAVATVFIGPLGQYAFLLSIALLSLAPGVLSLAWRPGGSARRARNAVAAAAVLLGLASAGLGLAANPCVADPRVVGLISALLFTGTLLVATAVGRVLAVRGGRIGPIVAAGLIAITGFFGSLMLVAPYVFVLC